MADDAAKNRFFRLFGYNGAISIGEPLGPAGTLALALKSIPAAASLMAYHWIKESLPLPDLRQGEIASCIQHGKKCKISLSDQRLLIISPTLDDSDLREAGKTLRTFFPAQVEALAFSAV